MDISTRQFEIRPVWHMFVPNGQHSQSSMALCIRVWHTCTSSVYFGIRVQESSSANDPLLSFVDTRYWYQVH